MTTSGPSFKPAEAFSAAANAAFERHRRRSQPPSGRRHDGGSWEDYEKGGFFPELMAEHGP